MKRDDWMKQQNIAETRKPYTPNRRNRRFDCVVTQPARGGIFSSLICKFDVIN